MFKFITRRHFILNLIVAIALVAGLGFGLLYSLGSLTHHGEFDKVPTVTGKSFSEAKKILEAKGFSVEVQDSLYVDSLPPLSTIRQSPEGDLMVKSHRIIYLTVNRSQAPLIEMPNLVGFSLRNAIMYLDQLHLKLGDTTRKPDIAKDAVLEQSYNGLPITGGTKIYMGSTINMVLGDGLGETEFNVPNLMGMTFTDAKAKLKELNLNLGGLVIPPGFKDTANGFVVKQNPMLNTEVSTGDWHTNQVREGQSIDIWLGQTNQPLVDTNTFKIDSLNMVPNKKLTDKKIPKKNKPKKLNTDKDPNNY